MSGLVGLFGSGAICIWHDLAADAIDDFHEWHNREHMPERVAIPGFQRGRRYAALSGSPRYFNLYEVDDVAVLGGADYLARLNSPTPWTQRVVASFRNVARSLCSVVASEGFGEGGVMSTACFDVPLDSRARVEEFLRVATLPSLARHPGIVGAHLCVADEAVSALETAEKRARAGTTRIPAWIVLIEGSSEAAVAAANAALPQSLADAAGIAAQAVSCAIYDLENTCTKQIASV